MDSDLYLSRIWGQIDALLTLPTNRPLGPDGINRCAAWTAAYHARGLPFATCREESDALRALTSAGLLAASGTTQSRAFRLTRLGLLAVLRNMNLDWNESGELLGQIVAAKRASKIRNPYDRKTNLCMGWMLVEGAGEWFAAANATDRAWKVYGKRLARLEVDLSPLLADRLVRLYVSGDGRTWAVDPTPEGLAAAKNWPSALEPDPGQTDATVEAHTAEWQAGYAEGQEKFSKVKPPAEYRNAMARILPASAWC